MRGLSLINPNCSHSTATKEEFFDIQKILTAAYIKENCIKEFKLNPYQVYSYYTIPHALLYDFQKSGINSLDILVIYSFSVIERFTELYPEKWEQLKQCFGEIVFLSETLPVSHSAAP
ncbi:hypothetical protein [Bacillus sp. MUM 13]|uniref:hypothetical protein n=1 Tax=Bacillus sp. MUM 13 TaxID=1678001 RepID=UPI0008F5B331|nr:hypothetical protein [Bacillus sp. MUM 13]OIK08698.1 hypothetical protein BIV59_19435 [Bacillus sp. MUM 13]